MFRKARSEDLSAILAIYDAIHTREEAGLTTIGWIRSIYPTEQTALTALAADDMFVLEHDGEVVACGRINQEQVDCYGDGSWQYPAPADQVLVLHTLVVDPKAGRSGIGSEFLRYYEACAAERGCPYLRLDTNERNTAARAFYRKHGYQEIGLAPCEFNGIPGVKLVLLEKKLPD